MPSNNCESCKKYDYFDQKVNLINVVIETVHINYIISKCVLTYLKKIHGREI